MGPSGVGSPRCCTCSAGSISPDSGRVEIFGQSLEELPPRERARFRNDRIGFVFQFHHLLAGVHGARRTSRSRTASRAVGARGPPPRAEHSSTASVSPEREPPSARALSGASSSASRSRARSRESPSSAAGRRADRQSRRGLGAGSVFASPARASPRARHDDGSRHAQPGSREVAVIDFSRCRGKESHPSPRFFGRG